MDDSVEARQATYYAAFNTAAGRAVLKYLHESLDGPSYRYGDDPLAVVYREGRRSVLRDILAAIESGRKLVQGETVTHAEGVEGALDV